jgi:hypothetical protein
MSFGLYSAGFAIVIIGLAYAAHLVRMPMHWIVVGAIVMIGIVGRKGHAPARLHRLIALRPSEASEGLEALRTADRELRFTRPAPKLLFPCRAGQIGRRARRLKASRD